MTQRQKRILGSFWVAVLAALAIRLVAVSFLYHDAWNPGRNSWHFGWESGRIARSIAEGHGFGNPLYGSTGPTALLTPAYPYLLAGVFKLFGVYSKLSALAILSLNSLFSALTCIPIFYIARRNFGRTTALWATWAWALFPYAIFLSATLVWDNCLTALLVTIILLLTLHLKDRPNRPDQPHLPAIRQAGRGGPIPGPDRYDFSLWAWLRSKPRLDRDGGSHVGQTSHWRLEWGWPAQAGWLGYGLLWGFTALVNASTLSLLPFFAGWALYRPSPAEGHLASRPDNELRPAGRPSPAEGHLASRPDNELRPAGGMYRRWQAYFAPASLLLLALAVTLLPWVVRNYRTFHRLIPLRDTFWLEVWVGNDGDTLDWRSDAANPGTNETELAEYDRLGETRYLAAKRQQALNFISHHPGEFLLTSFRRFVYTWTGYWSFDPRYLAEQPYDPANICFSAPLTLLMLVGLRQAFRKARDVALPYAFALLFYPMVYYVTHPEIQYRHVIDPEIVTLAVFGALCLIRSRRHGPYGSWRRQAASPVATVSPPTKETVSAS